MIFIAPLQLPIQKLSQRIHDCRKRPKRRLELHRVATLDQRAQVKLVVIPGGRAIPEKARNCVIVNHPVESGANLELLVAERSTRRAANINHTLGGNGNTSTMENNKERNAKPKRQMWV